MEEPESQPNSKEQSVPQLLQIRTLARNYAELLKGPAYVAEIVTTAVRAELLVRLVLDRICLGSQVRLKFKQVRDDTNVFKLVRRLLGPSLSHRV